MLQHRRRRKEHRPSPGEPPGSLSPAPHAHPTRLHLVAFDKDRLIQQQSESVTEIEERARGVAKVWIDVEGLRDVETIRALGQRYDLHPLTLEDIVQVVQRPKVDVYEGYLFVVLRLPRLGNGLLTEQVAIVLGGDFVLTFGERTIECFEAVRRRLTHSHSRMRSRGVDYLAYALI
ncbi:MAG TPA: CorA family divalent cation transporter, partial [Geminicoccaceae bacterium]|nr:CorA family divalent cation transporter [Geminicoccaceae bacterium]